MNYVSTRDTAVKVSASQAITKGISSEGGLFVPENLPKVSMSEIEKIAYGNVMRVIKESMK